MKTYYSLLIVLVLIISACNSNHKKANPKLIEEQKEATQVKDSILFSFSFMGCNRVNRGDTTHSVPSSANKYVLERIFKEMNSLDRKPDIFFFLGDLVVAESTLENLDYQLKAWEALYNQNSISKSSIELVAVPGNHEMLYSREIKEHHKDKWKEFPLKGSTDMWLNYMKDHMPDYRETAPSSDTLDNRLTFAFTRKNIGFVVMNTDSYNPPTTINPYGLEGQIPTQWIINKVNEYKKNPNIDHVFVLGHKPYYVDGKPHVGHKGLPEGPTLWPALENARVVAMLSAHLHDYQRWQPINKNLGGGTYQIIAGNGGSQGSAPFFGYSTISIMKSGEVKLNSVGFCIDENNYMASVPNNPTLPRDTTTLTWEKNLNAFPYPYPYTNCN